MNTTPNLRYLLVAFIAFSLASSMLVNNALTGFTDYENNTSSAELLFQTSAIVIDGNLSVDEWTNAEHKIGWYMDADPENSDGYNYMYIDEDIANLYFALDLCSDQTNDENGEWIGLWLNTNETSFGGADGWASQMDNGTESLLYDVDNDQELPFTDPDNFYEVWGYSMESYGGLDIKNGTSNGSVDALSESSDGEFLNMTSEYNGTDYISRLDVDVDFHKLFDYFSEIYASNVYQVQIWVYSFNNVSIDEHYVSVIDDQGELNLDNKHPLNLGTTNTGSSTNIYESDFTYDTNLTLSFNGINDAPFNTSYDRISFSIYFNASNDVGSNTIEHPYTSVNGYEIDWTFGPSENNASDHRSFEIKIPKSELEGYDVDKKLGIIVAGYGTLISWPNTHNWVYANGVDTGIPEESSANYYYYSMPMKGWTPPSDPVIDTISPDPDLDGNVLVNWNDDSDVENWTLYRHTSEITEINLDVATEVASGLIESQYNDTGLANGTYWYAVEAFDSFAYGHLSNSVSVTIEIPAPPSTTTTTTDTTTTTTTDTTTTTTTDTTTTTTTDTTTTTTSPEYNSTMLLLTVGAGVAGVCIVIVIIILKKRGS